ncbi:hypothetical protein [Nocardioides dongkuii]|uniref:hypothetical protein n=1 Tax=Nocardioides dongkuii TaxID=2760089 RepID=UPI0018777C35|nr:hypothetical protein [Nocardioides dongkuii]
MRPGTEHAARGRFRARYGDGPLHLLVVLASLALAAYAALTLGVGALWDTEVWWHSILVWFVGAAIAHDAVLFPAYALADRLLVRAVPGPGRSRPPVSALNHVRVPLLAAGLLLLLFFPGILEQGASSYRAATGQTQEPFLERWLLLSGLACTVSAVLYVARRLRAGRSREHAGEKTRP